MTITTASAADIPALNILVNSAYRGDSSRQGWTTEANLLDGIRIDEPTLLQYLAEPGAVILLLKDDDEKIVGCVYLKPVQNALYLGMLTVSPMLQGRGGGKQLLQAAEARAAATGCKKVVMTVISERHELIDWYRRYGYSDTGQKEPFPKGEKFGIPKVPLQFIVMEKEVLPQ